MRIEVIKGGIPDGQDLVLMGDHLVNKTAQVAERLGQMNAMPAIDLGDGDMIVAEGKLVFQLDGDVLRVFISGLGGRLSKIVGPRVVPVVLDELTTVSVAAVKAQIASALDVKMAEVAQ